MNSFEKKALVKNNVFYFVKKYKLKHLLYEVKQNNYILRVGNNI
ncbi:hypothetical protein Q604_UNBC10672G0002, partial [human gut metagenome]